MTRSSYETLRGAMAVVLTASFSLLTHAAEDSAHRQHEAHVHGSASLQLVLENKVLQLRLDSPAANIVGFEHAPSSDAERAVVDEAIATLKRAEQLFRLSPAAQCRLEHVTVEAPMVDAHGHEDAKEHGDHHEKGHHEDAEEVHSDIHAEYRFECAQPDRLQQLDVGLFEVFEGSERLDVQFVIGAGQGAADLDRSNHILEFQR